MKYSTAIVVAAASAANAGYCNDAFEEFGNFFCPNSVKQIKYAGLDIPGKYRAVASMDANGACTFKDKVYSGPIAPFNEDLTLHFRGPLELKSIAVYTPSSSGTQTEAAKAPSKRHHHGHQHLHKKHHDHPQAKRADIVTAVIDGVTQTWENNWFGGAATPSPKPASPKVDTAAGGAYKSVQNVDANVKVAAASKSSDKTAVSAGDFERVAYYSAKGQVADGLVFLGNVGDPAVSGTFDTVWGASLGYTNEDGTKAAPSPTVLKEGLIDDSTEVIIASDKQCDESCGTVRPGTVAYKGFEGANKVFLAEFSMPLSGKTGWNMDMPAFWMLNGAIPRTGQYSACSCWKGDNASPNEGGCGEADIIEVLRSGDTKAKSTFHFAAGTGDSHYFDRPVDRPIKVAVVFQEASSTASIKVLDDNFDFATSLTANQVENLVNDEPDNLLSLMTFGILS
ncbi:putative TOS1-like glycosyl hydrolase-domain-containing protein [Durotheca rogersii]|uniref:putative TOS1-like glycosyl hydrolase-domain-containing protein n=1 Tax=Durotheca rogersii TaxID=419775 RepID=UPI00222013C5|nr:putative TOS1-like glycosyl hydrolase-domain-containing protein [Durotheca rogersii]KAI5864746.1 putative TOS1-like glycosyl hydrolase-domain-containing protein [Durotheca rogersii]